MGNAITRGDLIKMWRGIYLDPKSTDEDRKKAEGILREFGVFVDVDEISREVSDELGPHQINDFSGHDSHKISNPVRKFF